jgi:hypothetical protein
VSAPRRGLRPSRPRGVRGVLFPRGGVMMNTWWFRRMQRGPSGTARLATRTPRSCSARRVACSPRCGRYGSAAGWPRPRTAGRLAGLVCPHHPVDGRARLARRRQNPCLKRGISTNDDTMIGYTVPEIRRLLAALFVRIHQPKQHLWWWSRWRRRRQHQARLSHYKRRGYPLT